MFLSSRRYFAGLIFSLFFLVSAHSQTLYWVGGSGNFNDPQNWSLQSGGSPSNVAPGPNSTLIFDNNLFAQNLVVTISGKQTVDRLLIQTYKSIQFVGVSNPLLVLQSGFEDILDNVNFNSSVNVEFLNNGSKQGVISTGRSQLQCDFFVKGGAWKFNKVLLNSSNTLLVVNSSVEVRSAVVSAGSFSITNSTGLIFDKAHFYSTTSAEINNNQNVSIVNSTFNRKPFSGPSLTFSNPTSSKFSNNNQINAPCVSTVLTRPSCSPGCDGTVVMTIPNFTCFGTSPTPTAINVTVDPGFCAPVAGFSTTVPGTFTLTAFCNCGNDYNIFVDDQNLAPLEFITASVVQPNIAFNANPALTRSLTCNGVCTGSVGASVFGGTAPYSFTVFPPQTSSFVTSSNGAISQTSLCAGILSITVRDAANCTQNFARLVNQPPAYNSNSVAANVVCNSACDGGFTIAPSGATPDYTVNLSVGGTFTAVPNQVFTQTNLCPGPVSATVTDRNGCVYINSVTITEPSTIIITPTSTPISCGGACTGFAEVIVTGGGGSYTYTWSPAGGTAATNSSLCASTSVGIHTVTITDIPHGCVNTRTFNITEIPPLTSSAALTHIACNSFSTGVITTSISGGTPGFTVTIIPAHASATINTSGTVSTISGLPADTYTVSILDAVGCTTMAVNTLTQNPTLSLTSNTLGNTCPTGPNSTIGQATLNASGGTGTYTYSWIGGNSPTASGLASNVYTATIVDAAGCAGPTINITIPGPLAFSFGMDSTSLACNNSSLGVITSTPSNGSGTYNFTLSSASNSFIISNSATATFSNLPGSNSPNGVGVYTLTVGDAAFPLNCTQSQTMSLVQPAPVTSTITMLPALCNGVCNGTLVGAASGGAPNYTYNWITPTVSIPNQQQINNQCASTTAYTLNVVDARGCAAPSATIILTEPSTVTLAITVGSVSCAGSQGPNSNGFITTTLTGGTSPYTYNWNGPGVSGATSTSIANLPGGTTPSNSYTLNYGFAGCVSTTVIPVAQATLIALAPTIFSTSCATSCDGSATIAVSGGRPNYNFQYVGSSNSTNTTGVFSSVCGTFVVTVTDANNCQQTLTSSIGTPSTISRVENTPSVTCFGACNGTYIVTPSGGTAPHSYTLTGPAPSTTSLVVTSANSATFSNLCGGNYVLSIRPDGTLATCPQTFAVNVFEPSAITPNATSGGSVSCFNACDGTYSVNPTGGTGVYSLISWTSAVGIPTTGAVIGGRCANVVHSYTITDNNNCSVTGTVAALSQPALITLASQNTLAVTCAGGANGGVTVTPAGGPAGTSYNYSWTPGGMTSNAVSGLTVGLYQVVVTSSINSCTNTFTFDITEPAPIGLTTLPTGVKCFGVCDGSVALTTTAGVAPFTYILNPSATSTNSPSFTGLCARTSTGTPYTVTAVDASLCATTATFFIGTPVQLAVAMTNTHASCAVCSGSAAVSPSGGTGSIGYTWANSGGTVATGASPTATALCFGNYTVTATDANSCVATSTLEIPQIVIAVISNTQNATCFGANNGAATVQISGTGTPSYAITWSPSAQTGSVATNLNPNLIYTVQVADSGTPSCTGGTTVQVTQPASISITGSTTPVSCPGINNGAITTTISGGPAGGTTSYSWSPTGFTTQNISNVGFGPHVITVSVTNSANTNTCIATQTFTVGSPDPLISATLNPISPADCVTPTNGTICVVTTTGGNPSISPYQYLWSPGGATTACNNNLSAGGHTVTITSNSCSQSFTALLTPPTSPTLTLVSSQSVSCNSFSTGAATFSNTGAASGFTWMPPVSTSSTTSGITGTNLFVPTGSVVQVYTVTMTNTNNCTATETVSIAQPASLTVNSSTTNIACNSASTGVISMTVLSGGTPGSPSYTFSPSVGAPQTGTNATFSNLPAGNYTINVTDGANCVVPYTFTLTQPLPFTYSGTTNSVTCNNACDGSITLTVTNGTGLISYSWAPVPAASFTGATTQNISNLCDGVFSVIVTDANGCVAVGPSPFAIAEPTAALATNTLVNHHVTCFGDCNGAASFTVNGGTGPYTYSWSTNSSTTTSAASLCIGQHVATAVDFNGCVIQNTFSIIGPTVAITTTLIATNPLCPGAFNGAINTTITGTQGNVTYSWSPVGNVQNPTGLGTGGTGTLIYTLTATDDSSCVHVNTVTLIDPAAIVSSVAITASPTCFGDCNGAATANFSNAVGSTTVTWLPMNTTSASIAGLCSNPFNGLPNIYSVTVVDQNGCRDTAAFALNNPTQLGINSTVTPAQCGPDNGSITINGTGGTPAYQYSWLGTLTLTTGTVQTGLAAGVYSVIVIDANNCRDTINIAVASINGPTATASSNTLLCNGVCSGSASISSISPTNVVITWLPPLSPTITATTINNLCAGTYTVELNDTLAGCKNYYSFAITQPNALSTTSTMTEPTCFGICDGALGVTISGGTPTYNLLWNGPNGFTATGVTNLTNVCGGVYTLNITDQNACTNTVLYSVPVFNNIVIQQPVSVSNNTCFGNCNGSATVNVISTTTNVLTANLNWSNSQFGNVATGLCNGIYTVLVTDTRGCSNTFTVPVTSPSSITLNSNVVQPACNRCDGSAVVTASGGNGPAYTYSWTTGDVTSSVTDLCAGLYQVVVRDNMNCQELHNVTINSSNGFNGDSVIVQHEQCGLPCSGAATITAQGGTSPITYNWLMPSIPSASSTGSNLCAGQYFVQMRDANNCIRTTPFTINPANTPTITAFVTPPVCGTTPANGSIQVTTAGLTGPATYSWAPVTSSISSINNVGTGIYTVIVTDLTSGCSASKVIPLSNPSGPDFTVSQQDINCAGQTGSVGITLTSTSTVTYLWSTGATTSSLTNLQGGPVTVTITDANGCEATRSFTIESNTPVESAAITQGIRCQGNCDGIISVLSLGGTLPYTYTWSVQNTNSFRADSLCSGNYTILVADAKGCQDTSVVNLVSPIAVTRTVNTVNSSCSTIPDGSASVIAAGGLAPYTYSWTGPNNFTSTNDSITNILPGNYTVVVIDSLGCTSQNANITVPPTVTLEANAGPDILVCPITDAVLSGSNSIGAIGYTWIAMPASTVAITVNHGITAIETETYVLQVLSTVPGCFDRDTVVVNVHPRPFLDAGPNSFTIPVRSSTVIGGAPTSLSGGPSHTWSPAEYLNDPTLQNPITNNTINVTFTVSIEYGDGCIESDTVQVLIQPEIRITSGFSPNGDGKNDTWILDYIDQFPNNTVEIYNRWGDQVFFSKGYFEPFDGNYKGQKLPVGTYYYVIHLNHESYTKPYTGPLTIFR